MSPVKNLLPDYRTGLYHDCLIHKKIIECHCCYGRCTSVKISIHRLPNSHFQNWRQPLNYPAVYHPGIIDRMYLEPIIEKNIFSNASEETNTNVMPNLICSIMPG